MSGRVLKIQHFPNLTHKHGNQKLNYIFQNFVSNFPFVRLFHKSLTVKIRVNLYNTLALKFYVPNTTFSGSPC